MAMMRQRRYGLLLVDVDTLHKRFAGVDGSIAELRSRQDRVEELRANTSERVRGVIRQTSEADLSHEAKLSEEIVARRTLEEKVDALDAKQDTQLAILTDIRKLAQNPIVKQVATAVGTAILVWLGTKGLR